MVMPLKLYLSSNSGSKSVWVIFLSFKKPTDTMLSVVPVYDLR